MKEYAEHMIIEVSPRPKVGTDWGGTKYFIKVDTDPNYAGTTLDTPIGISWGDDVGEGVQILMEPDDAEEVAHAIIRAVEIRRAVNSGLPVHLRPNPQGSAGGEAAPADRQTLATVVAKWSMILNETPRDNMSYHRPTVSAILSDLHSCLPNVPGG